MDGDAFAAYIRNVLVPELKPGNLVILDNLAIGRSSLMGAHMSVRVGHICQIRLL